MSLNNYLLEVNYIISHYRDNLNVLETKLEPRLSKVSVEARDFIVSFVEMWGKTIRKEGGLSDYATTAKVIQEILKYYADFPYFTGTVLYADMHHFLDVQKKEKDNDWYKSKAERKIFDDIDVLRFCFITWNEK